LLLITHDVALVRRQASRVVVLQAGRVVEMGSVSEVLARPRAAATRRLLEAVLPAPPPVVAGAEILRVEGLGVGRGRAAAPVVRDVSLALRAGETLGIAGESGAGKTSLGLAVLKLLPARGRVMFEGRDLAGLSGAEMRRARRFMQIVFQDPAASLAPRMLVEDIVAEALLAHEPGLGRAARRVRALAALEEVGLGAEVAERFAHECSGGQRQRVALARALILRPRLLVLDEPASALDAVARAAFCALLRRLQARTGMGFLLISHDLAVLRALAHRIIVLRNGAVVEEGAAADIFERPRADYTKCLMAAARVEAPSVVDG
jgi:ABC-type microcin C transport system duplicated ATPase subunit YejF